MEVLGVDPDRHFRRRFEKLLAAMPRNRGSSRILEQHKCPQIQGLTGVREY